MRNLIHRSNVREILQNHGIEDFTTQTGYSNGKTSEYGTSFNEQVGLKEFYTEKEIKEWLGY